MGVENNPITPDLISSTESKPRMPLDELRIRKIMEINSDVLGDFRLERVENAGYVLVKQIVGDTVVETEVPDVITDYDDVQADTGLYKKKIAKEYKDYLIDRFREDFADDDFVGNLSQMILDKTGKQFSRWRHDWRDKNFYLDAQMLGMQLYFTEFKTMLEGAKGADQQTKREGFERVFSETSEKLDSVLALLKDDPANADPILPFYFDKDGKMVMRGLSKIWDEKIWEIFRNSTIHTEPNEHMVEVMEQLGRPMGIFTKGLTHYQLEKVAGYIRTCRRQGRNISVSQIWLTEVPKGEFLLKLRTQGVDVGKFPEVIKMIDDNPKDTRSIDQARRKLVDIGFDDGLFLLVRERRLDTKTGMDDDEGEADLVIDRRDGLTSPQKEAELIENLSWIT